MIIVILVLLFSVPRNGETVEIDAKGTEKKLLKKSYVSGVKTDLVSEPWIQKIGHWILLPPTYSGSKIGLLVIVRLKSQHFRRSYDVLYKFNN